MNADSSISELSSWANNFEVKLTRHAALLGITTEQLAMISEHVKGLRQCLDTKITDSPKESKALQQTPVETHLLAITAFVHQLRRSVFYSALIGNDLGINDLLIMDRRCCNR